MLFGRCNIRISTSTLRLYEVCLSGMSPYVWSHLHPCTLHLCSDWFSDTHTHTLGLSCTERRVCSVFYVLCSHVHWETGVWGTVLFSDINTLIWSAQISIRFVNASLYFLEHTVALWTDVWGIISFLSLCLSLMIVLWCACVIIFNLFARWYRIWNV